MKPVTRAVKCSVFVDKSYWGNGYYKCWACGESFDDRSKPPCGEKAKEIKEDETD